MSHPYRNLPDHCFWSHAMSDPFPGHVDPVTCDLKMLPEQKIATMGSCFATHISRHITRMGLNYFVAEPPPASMDPLAASKRHYGTFSARYGNIYTTRQALQLIERAFGYFDPVDDVWAYRDGFVDAFRPTIEPEAHPCPTAVRVAAQDHLAAVRDMFVSSDWLIFTLGLTECWRSKRDGAVYPLAPGVHGGVYRDDEYAFANFSAAEVCADLDMFLTRLRSVNPTVRLLLTVSPVALVATYERRHVLVSNAYSKAALRVAAEYAQGRFEHVHYFPSYEIITSPAAGGRYYEDDLRSVNETGVNHVMSVFKRHFIETDHVSVPTDRPLLGARPTIAEIKCDEEWIEQARRATAGPV